MTMLQLMVVGLLGYLAICTCDAGRAVEFVAPAEIRKEWGVFKGRLVDDSSEILLHPEIVAVAHVGLSQTGTVCGMRLHQKDGGEGDLPFEVVLDKGQGRGGHAAIRVRQGVDSRTKVMSSEQWIFQLEAFDCDVPTPHYSDRKFVLVETRSSTAASGPAFALGSYHFSVLAEAAGGAHVGRVAAVEAPSQTLTGEKRDGGICRYEIKTEERLRKKSLPFSVSNQGVISVVAKAKSGRSSLQYKDQWHLTVKATDCNENDPQSATVLVSIDVIRKCKPQWIDMPTKQLQYRGPGGLSLLQLDVNDDRIQDVNQSSSQLPLHKASPSLRLCSDTCHDFRTTTIARLYGYRLRPAASDQCKREIHSLRQQATFCGSNAHTLSLLPESEQEVTYFNGSRQIQVSLPSQAPPLLTMKSGFSVAFWMKHGTSVPNGPKEHIICSSDDGMLNRHHYSVFVHNCKLILLLRAEPKFEQKTVPGKTTKYRASEWRFGPLSELCDDEWHHIAVSLEPSRTITRTVLQHQQPLLQIDGEAVLQHPQVLDDKPLHRLDHGDGGTVLAVGGCWRSKTKDFAFGFLGHLAGVTMVPDAVETADVVRCLATCGESLRLPRVVQHMDADTLVTLFSDSITVHSNSIFSMLRLLSPLTYLDTGTSTTTSKSNTAPANRTITLETTLECKSGNVIEVPRVSIFLHRILPGPSPPGSHPHQIIPPLVRLLPARLRIPISFILSPPSLTQPLKGLQLVPNSGLLQSCILRPLAPAKLKPEESLHLPLSAAVLSRLSGRNNSAGLLLEGRATAAVYASVLAKIRYTTSITSGARDRSLALVCAMQTGRITAQAVIQMYVPKSSSVAHAAVNEDNRTFYVEDVEEPASQGNTLRDENRDQFGKENKALHLQEQDYGLRPLKKRNWVGLGVGLGLATVVMVIAMAIFVTLLRRRRRSNGKRSRSWRNLGKRSSWSSLNCGHSNEDGGILRGSLRILENPMATATLDSGVKGHEDDLEHEDSDWPAEERDEEDTEPEDEDEDEGEMTIGNTQKTVVAGRVPSFLPRPGSVTLINSVRV